MRSTDAVERLAPERLNLYGWDTFAEYLLDISGLVSRPMDPTQVELYECSQQDFSNDWRAVSASELEAIVVNNLVEAGMVDQIPVYRAAMSDYRRCISSIISRIRKSLAL